MDAFAKVTTVATVGSEADLLICYYKTDGVAAANPSVEELTELGEEWIEFVGGPLRGVMPDDYTLTGVEVAAYKADGTPSTTLPVFVPGGGAGAETAAHDGPALVAIAKPAMGALTTLVSEASLLRRSYWAIGPVENGRVAENGAFSSGGTSAWPDLAEALAGGLAGESEIAWAPVRCSFTQSQERQPYICSYRPVDSVSYGAFTSFRRSRLNNR